MPTYRTTVDEVIAIYDTGLTTDQVQSFIKTANLVVTNNLTGKGINSSTLSDIERWLSAHFCCSRDPVTMEEKIGDATDKYERARAGEGFKGTSYGRNAILLDYTGTLEQVGKRKILVDRAFVVSDA